MVGRLEEAICGHSSAAGSGQKASGRPPAWPEGLRLLEGLCRSYRGVAAVGGGAFFSWESLRIGWTSMLYSLLDRFDMVRRGAKQPDDAWEETQ
jgi:hypothetical protein